MRSFSSTYKCTKYYLIIIQGQIIKFYNDWNFYSFVATPVLLLPLFLATFSTSDHTVPRVREKNQISSIFILIILLDMLLLIIYSVTALTTIGGKKK